MRAEPQQSPRAPAARGREAHGEDIGEVPDGLYPGGYLIDAAAQLKEADGGKWLEAAEEEWLDPIRRFAVNSMMALIRQDLAALGVAHPCQVPRAERAARLLGQ